MAIISAKYTMADASDIRGNVEVTRLESDGKTTAYVSVEALDVGMVTLTDQERVSIENTLGRSMANPRVALGAKIDAFADEVRVHMKQAGSASIDIEYEQVQSEFAAWDAGGRVAGEIPMSVQSWIDARGIMGAPAEHALNELVTAIGHYGYLVTVVRKIRLVAKANIMQKPWSDVIDTYTKAIDDLKAVQVAIPDAFG